MRGTTQGSPLASNWPNNSEGTAIEGNMGTGALHLDNTLEDLQEIGRLDIEFQDGLEKISQLTDQSSRKGRLCQHHRPRNPGNMDREEAGPLRASQTAVNAFRVPIWSTASCKAGAAMREPPQIFSYN